MGLIARSIAKVAGVLDRDGGFEIDNRLGILSAEQEANWVNDGFVVLPGLFSAERVEAINRHVDELWANRGAPGNPLVVDVHIGSREERRILFRDAPGTARERPYKLNDTYLESEPVRELALDERLANVLGILLGGEPVVINSLNVERGTQQDFHFDTFFMPPKARNRMLATWIALEDVHPDAGPLAYYPGSHRIPPYLFSDGRLNVIPAEMPGFHKYIAREIEARRMRPVEFMPRRGDVLIWHAQLFHGGAPIKDMARTRRSLITHYFREKDVSRKRRRQIGPGRSYLLRGHNEVD